MIFTYIGVFHTRLVTEMVVTLMISTIFYILCSRAPANDTFVMFFIHLTNGTFHFIHYKMNFCSFFIPVDNRKPMAYKSPALLALLALLVSCSMSTPTCVGVTDLTPIQGNGSSTNPFFICNVPQFNSIGVSFPKAKYWELGSNLYFTVPLNPIGDYSVPFNGIFNGNGFEVRHYKLGRNTRVDSALRYIGLFKAVVNTTIHKGRDPNRHGATLHWWLGWIWS